MGSLRRGLGLRDLVLAQLLYIIIPKFFGTAAKAGPAHVALLDFGNRGILFSRSPGRCSPESLDAARGRPLRKRVTAGLGVRLLRHRLPSVVCRSPAGEIWEFVRPSG